ncbi:FAD-dependent oxidoreductase [Desulfococcus sp.]|uniref:FAD-dependent oxidoreductase n=1 Tax=Desulfococcus sp. TaxID=2025834 RepID=UPI0035939D7D
MKVVIIGGGWAGCAAALAAGSQGAGAVLIERTDMLLGTGLVGGIMRNNGRFTATEEMIALGGGGLFTAIDGNLLHREVEFPGHAHASLYNVGTMEPIVRRLLAANAIDLRFETRITGVERDGGRIVAVTGKKGGETVRIPGDVFVETTGTAGPPANCTRYGNGCAMCVLRCHSFGGRVSVAAKAGILEMDGQKGGQTGAMSGSCKLHKESLAPGLLQRLNTHGVVVVPLPPELRLSGKLAMKACQQYAMAAFEENVILLDTGHAKLMSPFFPLAVLREIPGFENARYEDPYAGGMGNSVRYLGMSPRDDALRVAGLENLFCAGEKAGLLVGHTEAICTGTLAGYNAVRHARGETPLVLPESLAIGYAIHEVRVQMREKGELAKKFTFSGSVLFEEMKARGLYATRPDRIAERVDRSGLLGVFSPRKG